MRNFLDNTLSQEIFGKKERKFLELYWEHAPSGIPVLIITNHHQYYSSCEGPEAQATMLAGLKLKEDRSRDP
uniref:Uncharacterized protein n=1 Tax=Romanomermis culicivorax TaxID=13658 RepID=A0A915HT52_ROMCU